MPAFRPFRTRRRPGDLWKNPVEESKDRNSALNGRELINYSAALSTSFFHIDRLTVCTDYATPARNGNTPPNLAFGETVLCPARPRVASPPQPLSRGRHRQRPYGGTAVRLYGGTAVQEQVRGFEFGVRSSSAPPLLRSSAPLPPCPPAPPPLRPSARYFFPPGAPCGFMSKTTTAVWLLPRPYSSLRTASPTRRHCPFPSKSTRAKSAR